MMIRVKVKKMVINKTGELKLWPLNNIRTWWNVCYSTTYVWARQKFHRSYGVITGRDSSVGTATRYGLDGPVIESRGGRDFPHPSRPALGPTQPPVQWVPGLSRG